MVKQEIVWVGGYPFVKGVNAPIVKEVAAQPAPKPTPVDKPKNPPVQAGGHDLRGGYATVVKPR